MRFHNPRIEEYGQTKYNYSMKNNFFTFTRCIYILKTLYISAILGALSVLSLALLRNEPEYGFVNEALLRPICDDFLVWDFLLTLLSLAFIEKS